MQTANFLIPRCQFHSSSKYQTLQPSAHPSSVKARTESVPEHRLWKVCRTSPKLGKIELLIFVFFAIIALLTTACCFSELVNALENGAFEQTVRMLIGV